MLVPPLRARYIRVVPKKWHGMPATRIGLLGHGELRAARRNLALSLALLSERVPRPSGGDNKGGTMAVDRPTAASTNKQGPDES